MRFSLTSLLFVVLISFAAKGQQMPTSNGACSVSSSGLMGCEWLSTPPIRWKDGNSQTSKLPPKGVFVTRFTISPGALLDRMNEGDDILIVGMCEGELVNEAKAPKSHVNITNGLVMLMAKEDHYLLRNTGEKSLDLLVIDVRK